MECAAGGEHRELADCESAVGILGSAGEGVEEVGAVHVVILD